MPETLPVADTTPLVSTLPTAALPVTFKLARLPTDVRLENNTFELSVLPVKALALTSDAETPVSNEPLPMK